MIMSINKPYHRFYRRQVPNRFNGEYFSVAYLTDHEYAQQPEMYVRSFELIQEDVKKLFEYVEPADQNLNTYSMQIYNLFFRICVEVEANFKAILRENTYHGTGEWWNMEDYRKVNKTHHLSGYKVVFPIWSGTQNEFSPFADWATKGKNAKLQWYDIYNSCKHNRYQYMPKAKFETMLNAFAGLFALLSAQFGHEDYAPGSIGLALNMGDTAYYKGEFGIGNYLQIVYPDDWTEDEFYDFDWNELKKLEDRFQKYDYNII